MDLPVIDSQYLLDFLVELLNTPSPTGFSEGGIACVERALAAFPNLTLAETRKGALVATWPGEHNDSRRALTAHVDTLGAMVKEIKTSGRLKLSQIGNYAWNTIEGEGCTVHTGSGQTVRGSILLCKASSHVHGAQVNDTKREAESMEVRLDARTSAADGNACAWGLKSEISFPSIPAWRSPMASCARDTWTTRPVSPAWWQQSNPCMLPAGLQRRPPCCILATMKKLDTVQRLESLRM